MLQICCLGQIVFPATFSVSLTCGFLLSFVTTTFVMEAMAAANAQLRWKRMEIHKVCALPSSSVVSLRQSRQASLQGHS